MTDATAWSRAMTALALLAVDPEGLGGVTLRARAGPVRQSAETALARLPGARRRLHPGLSDTEIFGGLNVAASLAEGRAVWEPGLADRPALLILPMAERTPPDLSGRLSQVLDARKGHALVLLDEGADPDEAAPASLMERLAFHVDLDGLRWDETDVLLPAPAALDAARQRLPQVKVRDDDPAALVLLAARFGIHSLRAPTLALQAARGLAALDARLETTDADLRDAVELVYAHRATQLPQQPPEDAPEEDNPPPPDDSPDDGSPEGDDEIGQLEDRLLEAVAAALPPDLLARLEQGAARRLPGSGSGAGAKQKGNRRGRPLPSRPGRPAGRARIDVVATLRAAAPWQKIRRRQRPDGPRLILLPSDIRLRRFEDRSDRLLLFAVDASGSAAVARLAEAKGAVEMLLAQAYARRDHVALVSFRGAVAELLLPPTRSLVQAKRRLSALPGGGGTPLAAGLVAALALADQSRGRGLSPALVLLTDGRANVTLSGAPGREAAFAEAQQIARQIQALGIRGMVIDTANRPGAASADLARALGADYLGLPRADAQRISAAVSAALES